MKEQEIEELLKKSTLAWWEWNTKENKVNFNSLKVTVLGYNMDDFVNCGFEKFTNLLHPADYDKAMNAMRKVLFKQTDLYQVDYRIKDINGIYHWYIDRGYVIKKYDNGYPLIIKGIVLNAGLEHDKETVNHILNIMTNKDEEKSLILCSNCKRMKVKNMLWGDIHEDSVGIITDKVSHTLCPECVKKLYPEY